MACAKFYSDMIPYDGVTLEPIFHQIGKNIRAPGHISQMIYELLI